MMRLTAQYGDIWNTAYLGQPESLIEPLGKLRDACREVGRDPGTLEVTATVALEYPDLGGQPFSEHRISGSADELAAACLEYEKLGASHLVFHCNPYNLKTLERLAEAVEVYRRESR